MRRFFIQGFLLYPPVPLGQAAILDRMKNRSRNEWRAGIREGRSLSTPT